VCLGDKVIVFTNRPGKVKKEIDVNYRRPRLTEDSNLQIYYRKVLDELKTEIISARKMGDIP
jgi:NitT/TauT family transport system ATP-binding protein